MRQVVRGIGFNRILIFDENPFFRKVRGDILRAFEIPEIVICKDTDDVVHHLRTLTIDCVILDYSEDSSPGLKIVDDIRRNKLGHHPDIPIILCTANTLLSEITFARDIGISEIVRKPVSAEGLLEKLLVAASNPRDFVAVDTFLGPDRRRHKSPYLGKERRGATGLGQEQIDSLMNEKEQ